MNYTQFGHKFGRPSGIGLLMDDLAELLSSGQEMLMLGGGNPGSVPGAANRYRECLAAIAGNPDSFHQAFGGYGAPGGNGEFKRSLAALFNKLYGWQITERNIALTNGSQNAFFLLFNLFGGHLQNGRQAKILLPMAPEYIGYEDVSIADPFFISNQPIIDILDSRTFKYRVNFESLPDDPDINAICVSRPTNPTGNVLTDDEVQQLDAMAQRLKVPLIIDNAYGEPFPNIIHSEVSLNWHENIILSMSLSKLGLPSVRTGIVIAAEPLIELLTKMNSVINLTPTSIGPAIVQPLFDSGEIIEISQQHIRPFYAAKAARALQWFDEAMKGVTAYVHKPEGAIFLWLWFPDLPIDSLELYQRLKARGVLVIPGNYFFPGIDPAWKHTRECIRVSYAMDDTVVEQGMQIIGEEVRKAYKIT